MACAHCQWAKLTSLLSDVHFAWAVEGIYNCECPQHWHENSSCERRQHWFEWSPCYAMSLCILLILTVCSYICSFNIIDVTFIIVSKSNVCGKHWTALSLECINLIWLAGSIHSVHNATHTMFLHLHLCVNLFFLYALFIGFSSQQVRQVCSICCDHHLVWMAWNGVCLESHWWKCVLLNALCTLNSDVQNTHLNKLPSQNGFPRRRTYITQTRITYSAFSLSFSRKVTFRGNITQT